MKFLLYSGVSLGLWTVADPRPLIQGGVQIDGAPRGVSVLFS